MSIRNNLLGQLKRLKYRIISPPRYQLTKDIKDFLCSDDCTLPAEEKLLIGKYLSKNIIHYINYPFVNEYLFRKVNIFFDTNNSMHYVYHNNKKLFFKKNIPKTEIESLYNSLCTEQDIRSPHSYKSFNISYSSEDIAIDAGAAEGIWSLDIVDSVKELYLFECEDEWIDALNVTFAPWKDKVHIIKKYISNKTEEEKIRLDDYFIEKNIFPTIIKADIEGSEIALTEGASELLSKHLQHVILCTYHNENDYQELSSILERYGFQIQPSKGYIFPIYSFTGEYSMNEIGHLIRKALIYGHKQYANKSYHTHL